MLTNRDLPHVRADWLPALLAGEHACEWAVWFIVHHPDQVAPPSSDDEAAALLDQQKAEWAERGYEVSTDNAFLLRGRHAVLAGSHELIVSRDEHTLIINAQAPAHASRPFIEDVIDISRQLLARTAHQNLEPSDLPEDEHNTDRDDEPSDLPEEEQNADGTCPSCEQPLRLDGTCQNRASCMDFEYCDNLECRVCWDQCTYCCYTKSGTDGVCDIEDCPSHEPYLITATEIVTGPPWFKQAFDVTGPPWFTKPFRDRQQWHIT